MRLQIRPLALAVMLSASAGVAAGDVVVPVENNAPIALAARQSDAAQVRALLAATPRPDVNVPTSDGTSALHWAVYHNDVDLVDRLIKAGANVNAKNDY